MAKIRMLVAGLMSVSCLAAASAGSPPVAVVEEIAGTVAGVEFMDYVTPGTVIKLGAEDSIVLGYMTSCLRERITGGMVTIGFERSTVDRGRVYRTKVACDSSQVQMVGSGQDQSAATVFRNVSRDHETPRPPYVTIYGRSPIVEVDEPGMLVIVRLDERGERLQLPVDGKSLMRGKFFDLAPARKELALGGIYEARVGNRRVVFKVDPAGGSGATPMIGRLLRPE